MDQPLDDLLARFERERITADRHYHEALAAVDAAIQKVPPLSERQATADDSRMAELNHQWRLLDAEPAPAGRSWHGRLRDFVWRLVKPSFERQEAFNAALVDHLNRNARSARETPEAVGQLRTALHHAIEELSGFESRLVQFLQTITAYVDTKDRRLGSQELTDRLARLEQRLFAVSRQVDRLANTRSDDVVQPTTPSDERLSTFSGAITSTTYVGFEDRFRGARQEIRVRVEDYLPLLTAHTDVLDVGCGRGELLEALRARGVLARGIDLNPEMVELCRARGLDVERAEALAFLKQQPPASLGGLVAIQVVEHLTPDTLVGVLAAAYDALRPGAPLVLETINPAYWMAFFETYIRDPTHEQPLHPETLKYLVEASGFTHVDLQYRQPVSLADRLDRVTPSSDGRQQDARDADIRALVEAVNAHADKLNARLFSSADYAVIARR